MGATLSVGARVRLPESVAELVVPVGLLGVGEGLRLATRTRLGDRVRVGY